MKLQFSIVFKSGLKTVAEVTGREGVDAGALTVEDMVKGVVETEQFLEKLIRHRVHIVQVG